MGAAEVDVALRDGGHAELVVGAGEERGEGAGKHHVTVPHGTTHRHAHLTEERERERDDQVKISIYANLWFMIKRFQNSSHCTLPPRTCLESGQVVLYSSIIGALTS